MNKVYNMTVIYRFNIVHSHRAMTGQYDTVSYGVLVRINCILYPK